MAVMKSLRNMAFAPAAAVAATMMAVPANSPALAQDAQVTQVSASSTRVSASGLTTVMGRSMDAGRAAAQFSDNPNHIGVVIFYGNDVDPVHVGDAFAAELRRRGVDARSFAAPVSGTGASVHYQVGESGIGPLGVNTAAASMSRAVEISRARDRILSGEFTPARGG